jgi:hypothetical protein
VFGALTVTALKGGVMAQRTLIQLMLAEDERIYAEREKTFSNWRDYAAKMRSQMTTALAKGLPAPAIVPHPDDIVLDYATLTVTFIGPTNREEAAQYAKIRRAAFLVFELSLYHGEDTHFDALRLDQSRIGLWLIHHIELIQRLPPRMRTLTEAEEAQRMSRIGMRRGQREAYLRIECDALNLPFIASKRPWPAWVIGELVANDELRAFFGDQ